MSKISLSQEDLAVIQGSSDQLHHIMNAVERMKTFSNGDFLIKTIHRVHSGSASKRTKPVFATNSYGVKRKYQVVDVDKNGAVWIKEISSTGKPKGPILCPLLEELYGILETDEVEKFEIDPEFVDSMILGPSAYNPTEIQNSMSKTWKEITEHNKKHIKRFKTISEAVSFFKTIKSGDQFWTSSKKYFTVIDAKTISSRGTTSMVKGPYVIKLLVKFVDGTNKQMYPDDIVGKVLYTSAPRSYKKEINPNR
jgi:hypothetical protein